MRNNILTTIFSLLIVFIFLELILRFSGDKPTINDLAREEDPVVYKKHNKLGWVHKPGEYLFQPWSKEGKITKFTINEDGSRKIRNQSESNKKILFFGGSLTEGWAVGDEENFVNYFQNFNLNFKVFNFGVGGYGGFQSLLLQEIVTKNLKGIDHIIYGFIDHHEVRNVASGSWLYLLNKYSNRGHVKIPFASLDSGNLTRNEPTEYFRLPLSSYSALISKIEKRVMKLKSYDREKNKFEISKLIIENMYSNSNNLDAKFTVVFLDVKQENLKNYKDFFYKKNINFVNCQFNPDEIVLGESHPNALNHKIVAQCLSKNLKLN